MTHFKDSMLKHVLAPSSSRTHPASMTEERSRRLAAVMFTDVVGYTALMQDDEEAARIVRLRHREALEAAIDAHGGELVQYLGDGSLSTFPSAVRAVSAAVEIQRALREDVPLRIGVHQGEIAFDDQGIYVDSVNVASRVMGLGTAVSVLVSEKAQDELKNQRDFSTASLGYFDLKNVKHLLPVYAIRHEGLNVPRREELVGQRKGSRRVSVGVA
ncbi:MAG: adenylate/guanylate cyclase domain-containing protein, partial [Ignavibacteria bacterium]|nr:adenylate/guanylate cyclase domain-containing protein [Ignavibacteria bacterium]